MTRRGLTAGIVGVFATVLAGCSSLTIYNALGPRDPVARQARDIAYGSSPRQKLDVYAPAQTPDARPVLVFFYGGSWNSGRRQDYAFVGQALAARGFVTVIPDYRLVPEVRYPAFLRDGAAAVRWARDHAADYGGDPRRIVLVGHSAGAYNAMMLALDGEFLKDAGVDPATIKAVAGLSGPYDFLPLKVRWMVAAFGGYPNLPATQPINHASGAGPPVFLAHGDKDTLVSPRNTVALGRKLEQAGGVVEVKLYPGLRHPDTVLALSRLFRGRAPLLDDMTAFLMAHAGAAFPAPAARAAPLWATEPEPPPLPKPDASGFVENRGARLYYAVFHKGGGRPVILLHGGLLSSDSWGFEVPKLMAAHEVIVMDSRGQGITVTVHLNCPNLHGHEGSRGRFAGWYAVEKRGTRFIDGERISRYRISRPRPATARAGPDRIERLAGRRALLRSALAASLLELNGLSP